LRFDVVVKDKKTGRQGITRNISTEGCFLKREGAFQELLPVGSAIDLMLHLPNTVKNITIKGVVQHHGMHDEGMGIAFQGLNREDEAIIQQFITTFLDDLADDTLPGVKDEYWAEVARLRVTTSPAE
jgi:hypothetical protein